MGTSSDHFIDISSTEKVIIKPIKDDPVVLFGEATTVFAINWFNLKSSFFYNLYSLLATKYVIKASGKLIFKGTLIQQLNGSSTHCRKNLLIVSYQSPKHFLKLVSFKFFQLVSVFRVLSVKQFCFAFSKNIYPISNIEKKTFTKQQIYLVHHFKGDKSWLKNNFEQLANTAIELHVKPFFCGIAYANLVREKVGVQQSAKFPMDGMMLFAADSCVLLEQFAESEQFVQFKNLNVENASYLFARNY